MGAIEHLTIALSADAAARVRARVSSGSYPDVSAVVTKALATLDAQDDEATILLPEMTANDVDRWLRTEVVAICDKMDRDPSRGIPIEHVVSKFRSERVARGE